MPSVQEAINELFDSINSVLVAPVNAIMEQDKQICIKHIKGEAPVKIVLGTRRKISGRVIYTEPAPEITEELIRRIELFSSEMDKIFDESPEEFGKTFDVPLTLPNGSVINVESKTLDYSFVIYALPNIVISHFDVIYRDKGTINRLFIKTQYPTASPDSITSRISILTAGSSRAVELFKRYLASVSGVLDDFSKDVSNLLSNDKLNIPEKEISDISAVLHNNKVAPKSDPSFF